VTAGKFYNAILDSEPYSVKAAVCFGDDTLMNAGDVERGREALMALDFYVHMDIFANNSAAFADLLLPACTPWEIEAVKAFFPNSAGGDAWAQLRKAVIPAEAEARTDMEVLFDLAVRLGLGYPQGPLAMGDALGAPTILRILNELMVFYGDPRYRPSPWLKRRAMLGISLLTPEN